MGKWDGLDVEELVNGALRAGLWGVLVTGLWVTKTFTSDKTATRRILGKRISEGRKRCSLQIVEIIIISPRVSFSPEASQGKEGYGCRTTMDPGSIGQAKPQITMLFWSKEKQFG